MKKIPPPILAAVWLVLIAALANTQSVAQIVPELINYQGKLVNSSGLPVTTGDYQLRFRIYDATAGGNLIWGPQVFNGQTGPGYGPVVPIVQGWFNVILGPVDTNGAPIANAFGGTNRFMEIQLGANLPFTPRLQILSSPYALLAGSVPDGNITAAKIANGAVGSDQLSAQAVQAANIANGAVGSNQLGLGAVRTDNIASGAVGFAQLAPGAVGFIPRNIQAFTSSGTWTRPAGVSNVYVKVIGRGGSGASPGSSKAGGGGGGGGYAEGVIAVTGDIAVVIGNVSSFAGVTTISATSGQDASGQSGGNGGSGSGGSINLTGSRGQSAATGVDNLQGGSGGGTPMGAGGGGAGFNQQSSTYFAAGNGGGYGGGGGGATNVGQNAGAGAAGAVIVYY